MESATTTNGRAGCLAEVSWLSMGFIRPTYSVSYYRRARRRPVAIAAAFFVIFGLALTFVATLALLQAMVAASQGIEEAFQSGEFPEITIADGRASIAGRQPIVLTEDETGLIVLDTTGTYTSIDRSAYLRGILMTETEFHVLDNNQYRILPLSDLQELLGNPFLLNESTALRYWRQFTALFTVFSLIALSFWNILIWFMWLSFLAIVFWGFASLFQRGADFREILILGIYAYVPATYLQMLFGLAEISIFGLRTLLLLGVWGFIMIRLLGSDRPSAPSPKIEVS